ncbi:MAG: acyl-CoA dehydrogenase N-terminal domain-containing protein, partial [Rhodocyclaceae bacterium]|nr:acyl-CoA dehydrogenase N-terminal domain-containing protein [Rhodocyclaceae bacterium]
MSTYTAPLKDMQFVLTELAGIDKVAALPGCEEATADVVAAILDES